METFEAVRPERVLLLVNPLSFRLSLPGAFNELRQHCIGRGLTPHVVYGPTEIAPLLAESLGTGLDLIIVVGGDGTLQATVTLLATTHRSESPPSILMLGGGRTNYTAAHLGTQSRPEAMIDRALSNPHSFKQIQQASLAISQPGHESVYGFFMGGALVDHVIRDCHTYRATGRGRLRQGRFSTVFRVTQLGFLGLLHKVGYHSRMMYLKADGIGTLNGRIRLLVATTLDKEQVTVHPYLVTQQAPIKITAITRDAVGFWRHLLKILKGRTHPTLIPENGYFSGASREVSITGLGPICVDGQEYVFDETIEAKISEGPTFRFLSL